VNTLPPSPPPLVPKGRSCFATGCLSIAIAVILLVAIIGGGGWYLYGKAVSRFTSPQPVDIGIIQPTTADFRAAEEKLDRLRQATANNQEIVVEFTAVDFNTLIARNPNFIGIRNRARIAISDSVISVELSAPLNPRALPKLKGRWFNGTARFGFGLVLGQFVFDPKSAEADGHELPQQFLAAFAPSFNKSFNESFQRELNKNEQGRIFWSRVKTIGVEGDKLVVTTQRL
jgi:hypothetical protein